MHKIRIMLVTALLILTAAMGLAETGAAPIEVGDIVTFGAYEQNNVPDDGKEPIEWRVLQIEENTALVISRYALDAQPYNETPARASWVNCTLRAWLNDAFLNAAFTEEEKQAIVAKETVNWKEANTQDPVFLLDNDQAKQLFASNQDRQTTPTAYAVAQGAYQSKKYGPGNAQWWLRTISWESKYRAAYVAGSGGVMTCGGNSDGRVENRKWAVRPAMYLHLDAL